MKKRIKTQVLVVTVPNGSPAGVPVEGNITLDKAYDSATGLGVSIGNGFAGSGNTYVDIGLRDAYGQIEDDQHMEAFQANAGVAPDQKLKSLLIKNTNQVIYARVIPTVVTTSQFTVQFRFRLEDTMEVVARV
jgi:hypothetical protein